MRISVLDQSPIVEGSTGQQALANTLDLARLTDRLGFHRYWVAEHHGGPMLASPSPEVLIGPIAAATHQIRVGSGGVMLPHYSPLKVAENFSMLAGMNPGRVDLGIGRAPGSDGHTMLALQRDRRTPAPDDFPNQLAELLGYFEDALPHGHPFARYAKWLPGRPQRPDVWLLGSSEQSALWAAELGVPYSFADFINPRGAGIAQIYRERFEPSHRREQPEVSIGVWALAADTDEEAQLLSTSARMAMTMLRQGRLIEVPTVERAVRFLESQNSEIPGGQRGRRTIVGTPQRVRDGIEAAAVEYGADEVLVVTIVHDHAARRRSYELIAEQFDLTPATAQPRPQVAAPS
ncbi:LLM class flavin-dependent oxidoreductase [Conexibacter sp. CPCC 206217]|uniref:LLM class flavin-dependent oxidoreductase n=1 Tax=Conexibacter sp. CPCC 206217 TaxID=3064574 RepID=UPI00271A4261|nr:LLM class flavin-dependent oxidoreductase [Conexibacter sp. CPCC 206217]MDO8212117.1 LLM class flavin-dependent oxidoreductase [Conexibacter sp. CPCC 206217]